MKLPYSESAVKSAMLDNPLLFKKLYPKRIACPLGFYDPIFYAALNCIRFSKEAITDPKHQQSALVLAALSKKVSEYNSPTYFLDDNFADAVIKTNPPDFPVEEIKLPMPAFQLCISEKFSLKHFEVSVPFAMVGWIKDDKLLCWGFMVLGQNKLPYSEFTYKISRDNSSESVKEACNIELDSLEEKRNLHIVPPEISDEEITQKVNNFIMKLIIVLMTRPALTTEGIPWGKRTKTSFKHSNIWNPSWIGINYNIQKEEITGSHASPCMHWRRGHIRKQVYGPLRSQHKLIWIEPVLVNS